jgi:hypothetical protein
MNIKRWKTKAAKLVGGVGKRGKMSRGAIVSIRLLSAAALVTLAVMAIVVDAADQSTPKRVASASTPAMDIAATSGSTDAKTSTKPVPDSTYVGCLRAEDDGKKFVLTEIGGTNAPKSRNWKTAFITKKSGKLDVKPVGSLKLAPHVNKTVQMTGKRIDNDFTARSMKIVGSTCN